MHPASGGRAQARGPRSTRRDLISRVLGRDRPPLRTSPGLTRRPGRPCLLRERRARSLSAEKARRTSVEVGLSVCDRHKRGAQKRTRWAQVVEHVGERGAPPVARVGEQRGARREPPPATAAARYKQQRRTKGRDQRVESQRLSLTSGPSPTTSRVAPIPPVES